MTDKWNTHVEYRLCALLYTYVIIIIIIIIIMYVNYETLHLQLLPPMVSVGQKLSPCFTICMCVCVCGVRVRARVCECVKQATHRQTDRIAIGKPGCQLTDIIRVCVCVCVQCSLDD